MLKLLDRQMVRGYFKAYLVCLSSLLSLYIVVDLFTNLDDFTHHSGGLPTTAKLIGISDRKLWEMVDHGEVPHVKLGGRLVFRVATLDKWLEERERASSGGSSAIEGRIS